MVLCGLQRQLLYNRSDVRRKVISCARVRRCALVSIAFVVFIVGAAVCSSLLILAPIYQPLVR